MVVCLFLRQIANWVNRRHIQVTISRLGWKVFITRCVLHLALPRLLSSGSCWVWSSFGWRFRYFRNGCFLRQNWLVSALTTLHDIFLKFKRVDAQLWVLLSRVQGSRNLSYWLAICEQSTLYIEGRLVRYGDVEVEWCWQGKHSIDGWLESEWLLLL